MKNAFKFSLLALAISLSVVACGGKKSGNSADSTKIDSSSTIKSRTDTSVRVDTTKTTDTSVGKTDTVGKTITKHTENKKTVIKKN